MPPPLPSTQALACFEAAARHQSYTRAAQELALTQGAVSRQIGALESLLGVVLFHRTRHGVALTESGQQYARQVARWLLALRQGTLDVMAQSGAGASICLAAVPTFATRWLVPRLPLLAREHPDITVHIDVRTRPFLFAETAYDAALLAATPGQIVQWPGVQAQWLLHEDIVPVCSPALLARAARRGPGRAWQPVSAQAVAQLPLLQQSTRPQGWQEWFEAAGVPAAHALQGPRYELFSMLAAAASQGLGVALIPPLLIEEELARGALVIACARPLRQARGYYLVWPEPAPHGALARFAQWLAHTAAAGTPAPA
ncbi:LysR family transcriptional regulator [Pulveribacter suum]|uniref:LysR family transcriptional regulator n=1 Tax=Pulveribacter suum TaxID=2116657 RepID=A0A2P1NJV3_9BURK|nr:LysR family transcriptional regulator [Pulveribacter suum]AVP57358.1 LysR family transcriptional regulator [Pulveribacter suum]